jgi:hypothetical protein
MMSRWISHVSFILGHRNEPLLGNFCHSWTNLNRRPDWYVKDLIKHGSDRENLQNLPIIKNIMNHLASSDWMRPIVGIGDFGVFEDDIPAMLVFSLGWIASDLPVITPQREKNEMRQSDFPIEPIRYHFIKSDSQGKIWFSIQQIWNGLCK